MAAGQVSSIVSFKNEICIRAIGSDRGLLYVKGDKARKELHEIKDIQEKGVFIRFGGWKPDMLALDKKWFMK